MSLPKIQAGGHLKRVRLFWRCHNPSRCPEYNHDARSSIKMRASRLGSWLLSPMACLFPGRLVYGAPQFRWEPLKSSSRSFPSWASFTFHGVNVPVAFLWIMRWTTSSHIKALHQPFKDPLGTKSSRNLVSYYHQKKPGKLVILYVVNSIQGFPTDNDVRSSVQRTILGRTLNHKLNSECIYKQSIGELEA